LGDLIIFYTQILQNASNPLKLLSLSVHKLIVILKKADREMIEKCYLAADGNTLCLYEKYIAFMMFGRCTLDPY